jgi:hypothetical protein
VGAGFSPLDEQWQLLPSAYSPWLVEAVVRLGTWMPFERVPEALACFTGVAVSGETVRRLTEAAGRALVAAEDTEVAHLAAALLPAPAGPPVQQLSVDGAMVPLVGGQWGEVKLLALGTIIAAEDAGGSARTTDLSYFARLTDAEAFGRLATLETHRRGTETAGQVAAVMDGAVWQQGFVDLHRPDAVRILDFPHAAEHLTAAVAATLGKETPQTRAWLDRWLHELKHGDPADVLEAICLLPTASATDPVAAEAARAGAVDYLAARWGQIQYATFLAAGLPIGSGCVEGGHKLVMQARMKGSGMHWAAANVDPLLALRCAACTDRWTERWHLLSQRWRTTTSIRRLLRFAVRHAPPSPPTKPPPPKRIVNGRPTADHPWKRRPLLTARHRAA